MAFVHLHNHSCYSLLDGKSTPEEMILRAKELGQSAVAITDHGVMHGVIDFFNAGKKHGVKPIIGCEVYVAPGSRFDKTGEAFKGEGGKNYYHLVLIAKNNEGYKNLMKIVQLSYKDGYYYKPRTDKEILNKYKEGLIVTSSCLGGPLNQKLIGDVFTGRVSEKNYQEALNEAIWYRDTFGYENFFVELQNHGIPEQKVNNPYLEKIAKEIGVKVIVANDAHYAKHSDAKAHDVMLCIQTKSFISEVNRFKFDSDNFYMKSEEEMLAAFPGKQEYLDNTQLIADMCDDDLNIGFNGYKLPVFDVPEWFEGTNGDYLRHIAMSNKENLFKKKEWTREYDERFEKEYSIIDGMGFTDYFLIVQDYINWARSKGMLVGPGRGSAAGSLVTYLLGITSRIDPIEYELLFERFLNPERINFPDIDIDFPQSRREEVIDYVRDKYGHDRVSNIITFGTLKAKAALKDVARVFEIPFNVSNKMTKLIPDELDITLEEAWEKSPQLREFFKSDPKYIEIWEMAKEIEGLPRNSSIHASGVIVCSEHIEEVAPTMMVDGETVVQFSMGTAEAVGLIKMDFLGLRTLDTLQYTIDFVKERTGKTIDLDTIPYDDEETFEMLGNGGTSGVFQFESEGMTKYMMQLKPKSISELAVLNAMYRPGPMDFIPDYIQRRANPALAIPVLNTPEVREVLGPTLQIPVYQEQVMQIFQKVAGFTLARADIVRKAMGKKNEDVMQEEFKHFKEGLVDKKNNVNIPGTRAKGIPDEKADALLAQLKDFAKYAFNKSHAVAYSVVAYQTAYLRCHYPLEFMSATISSWIGKNDKVSHYISKAGQMGLRLIAPDVNQSTTLFKPYSDNEILFALNGIKGVGDSVATSIINERKNGKFETFYDFLSRTKRYSVGESTIEALIQTNAFSFTGYSRTSLLTVLKDMNALAKSSYDRKKSGQRSIFSLLTSQVAERVSMPEIVRYENNKDEVNRWEKNLTSLYITNDPLEDYTIYLEDDRIVTPDILIEKFEGKEGGYRPGNFVNLIGVVGALNDFQTKKGSFMARPIIESKNASVSTLAFPKFYSGETSGPLKIPGTAVLLGCRINENDEEKLELIINKVHPLRENKYFKDNKLTIYDDIADSTDDFGLRDIPKKDKRQIGESQNIVMDEQIKGRLKGVYIKTDLTNMKEIAEIAKTHQGLTPLFLVTSNSVLKTNMNVSRQKGFVDAVKSVVDKKDIHVE